MASGQLERPRRQHNQGTSTDYPDVYVGHLRCPQLSLSLLVGRYLWPPLLGSPVQHSTTVPPFRLDSLILSSSSGQITQESRTLSNLYNHVRTGQSDPPRIVAGIELHTSGSADELWAVLCERGVERSGNPDTQGDDVVIDIVGSSLRRSLVNEIMALSPRTPGGLRELANVLVTQLSATGRIELADPVAPVDFGREPRQHPLHDLHQDRDLEKKIGRWFKRAFGEELAVDRAAGRPNPAPRRPRP